MRAGIIGRLEALELAEKHRRTSEDIMSSVDVLPHIAPVYVKLHEDIRNGMHSVYNLPGGRGSCKSSFVSLEIVSGVMRYHRRKQCNSVSQMGGSYAGIGVCSNLMGDRYARSFAVMARDGIAHVLHISANGSADSVQRT